MNVEEKSAVAIEEARGEKAAEKRTFEEKAIVEARGEKVDEGRPQKKQFSLTRISKNRGVRPWRTSVLFWCRLASSPNRGATGRRQ